MYGYDRSLINDYLLTVWALAEYWLRVKGIIFLLMLVAIANVEAISLALPSHSHPAWPHETLHPHHSPRHRLGVPSNCAVELFYVDSLDSPPLTVQHNALQLCLLRIHLILVLDPLLFVLALQAFRLQVRNTAVFEQRRVLVDPVFFGNQPRYLRKLVLFWHFDLAAIGIDNE